MRIAVLGGGPGGLLAALLAKRSGPGRGVTVFERNRAGDTFGFGEVFSDATLDGIDAADPVLRRALDGHGVHRARWDAAPPHPADVAVFLLSDGTTGLPKLIARTHNDYAYNARASAQLCGLDEGTVYLVALPASHNFPLACPGILGTLLSGGQVVMAGPDPRRAFDVIEREGVTITAVVPAVAQRWLAYAADHGASALRTLDVLQVGGARLADELARKVRPVLGATLQQVFGMAEGLLNYTRLDDPDEVICSTQGRPLSPGDEVRIVDADGNDRPDGEPGALLTRGPYTPRGYYRAPEQNARAFTPDGWYASGDVVRRRPDGNLVVEGRDKDMINRGGEKISAEEVENLLYKMPGSPRSPPSPRPTPNSASGSASSSSRSPGRTSPWTRSGMTWRPPG